MKIGDEDRGIIIGVKIWIKRVNYFRAKHILSGDITPPLINNFEFGKYHDYVSM